MPEEATTLIELLRLRAQQPQQCAYRFLNDGDGDGEPEHMSYVELDQRARAIGALLQQQVLPGERALLLYPPGLNYIAAFFGCLYAGVVAVPAYPPNPSRLERTLPRLQTIVRDARPAVALTNAEILPMAEALAAAAPEFAPLRWLATNTLSDSDADLWRPGDVGPAALAMLQYTSGSTSRPKGVMLTHGNLLSNLALIHRCFGHTPESSGVIWLPPYHDMGLIGGILEPLHGGFPVTLMSPVAFLQRPLRWLQAVSHYRATTSGGPNFAYDLCVRKITPEQRAGLDLSSWTVAFNGAEPIHAETMDRFADAFASCGFRRDAFLPCYGLAEATLIVSGKPCAAPPVVRSFQSTGLEHHRAHAAGGDDPAARQLVGCGSPLAGQLVAIVDPLAQVACAPGVVGEIWVSGASVAQGYWERPEESLAAFGGQLAGHNQPFLRTGDLGFVQEGELFVTGRIKDLLIIRGRNYYPQDIEQTVGQAHPALRAGCGAAFAVTVGAEEQLVVVHELERQQRHVAVAEVASAIRQAVAEQHELQVYAVALLPPATIPKTSSGKIERYSCRAGFLDGSLAMVGSSVVEPSDDQGRADQRARAGELAQAIRRSARADERRPLLVGYLQAQLAQLCQAASLPDPALPLTSYGLDSLAAAELKNALEVDLGVDLAFEQLLDGSTVDQLSAHILDLLTHAPLDARASTPALRAAPLRPDQPHPLSLDQERLWLLDRLDPGAACYSIPAAVRLLGPLDLTVLQQCLTTIVQRHATLRTHFTTANGLPAQLITEAHELPLPLVDLSALPHDEQQAELQRHVREVTSQRIDLACAPLLRAAAVRLSAAEHVLVLALHHIVGDLWSMAVLFRELAALYPSISAQVPTPLPALPVQYVDFVHWQRARFQAPQLDEQLAYWRARLADLPPALALPSDRPRPATRSTDGGHHRFTLPQPTVAAIQQLSQRAGVTPFMVLLAAFKLLLHRLTGQDDLLVGAPIAGRTQQALEPLIGFFAYPLVLRSDLSGDPTFQELLARVRQVTLDAYAHQDVPFAKVVEAAQPARNARHHPLFQVMFGFLSKGWEPIDASGLRLLPLHLGRHGTDMDLFLTIISTTDEFHGILEYSTALFDAHTVEQFAAAYCGLLDRCLQLPEARLSDFQLPEALARRVSAAAPSLLAVSATFTAEPVKEALEFWMDELGLPGTVAFAPYNQVFQQLLDPSSLLRTNANGANVVLIRLEDWLARSGGPARYQLAEQQAHDFVAAIQGAAEHAAVPYVVCLCARAPETLADPADAAFCEQLESWLSASLRGVSGVSVVTAAALAARYLVEHYYDPYAHELGSIPFTPAYFAALGTSIVRTIVALQSAPRKVLVLDCDNTLWRGVVAEDGVAALDLAPPYLALQQWAAAQQDAGMLLCLCSKNSLTDIEVVFDQRPEMPLRREHITSWRVNWQPKSANLRSLADELGLGLESFIFIDDNPVECAEVAAQCPEVLTLQLPQDATRIPALLNHIWPCDERAVTDEDRRRSAFYREQQQRERARAAAGSLADFLAQLELVVDIQPLAATHAARVAQLTQRTNQFNTTTIRRTEHEVLQLSQAGQPAGLVVWVRDRYGDYGLVGAVLFAIQGDALLVDSFLLSCRALGRGVEHRMLAQLGAVAQERGLRQVTIPYAPTPKNQPAHDFLLAIGAAEREHHADGLRYHVPAAAAAQLRYQPSAAPPPAATPPAAAPVATRAVELQPEQLRRIALELSDPDHILQAIQQRRQAPPPQQGAIVAPRNATEEILVDIWCELLGVPQVSIDADFFELGGHSLLAVQMLSRVRDAFGIDLPIDSMFVERFCVADLAQTIADAQLDQADTDELAAMLGLVETLSDEELAVLLEAGHPDLHIDGLAHRHESI